MLARGLESPVHNSATCTHALKSLRFHLSDLSSAFARHSFTFRHRPRRPHIKAATPISPPHVLLPLLHRAAQLGSLPSILRLATLYTYGITRGLAPVVTLVQRDPQRAIRWALQGCHVLGKLVDEAESEAEVREGAQAQPPPDAAEREERRAALLELVHLLSRLARSRAAAWPGSNDAKGTSVEQTFWQRLERLVPKLEVLVEKVLRSSSTTSTLRGGSSASATPAAAASEEQDEVTDEEEQEQDKSLSLRAEEQAADVRADLRLLKALLDMREVAMQGLAASSALSERILGALREDDELIYTTGAVQALLAEPKSKANVQAVQKALWRSLPEEEEEVVQDARGQQASPAAPPALIKRPSFSTLRSKSEPGVDATHALAQSPNESFSALDALQQAAAAACLSPEEQAFDPFFIEHSKGGKAKSLAYLNPPSPTASIRSISSTYGFGEEEEQAGASFSRPRRPSSVCSDSPSLLFHEQERAESSTPALLSPTDSPNATPKRRPGLYDRRRVASMYGSMAPSPSLQSLPTLKGRPSKLAFLMSPTLPSSADHSSTATGTLGRSTSYASSALRQFAGQERPPPVPLNPATRLMRTRGNLRSRAASIVSSPSVDEMGAISQSRSSSTTFDSLAQHGFTDEPPEEQEQEEAAMPTPPSPARSNRSARAFAGLDPTSSAYATGSGRNSPSGSQKDISLLSVQPTTTTGGLDRVLAAAEDQSKLRTGGACTICQTTVVNGAMNRKGEIFCGRACRLESKRRTAV